MRWTPHGYWIDLISPGPGKGWRWEASARGLEKLSGPDPGLPLYSQQRQASAAALRALRHQAFRRSTTGWSKSGMAHATVSGHPKAFCSVHVQLGDSPNTAWKVSPRCGRCERILEQLDEMFPEVLP